MDLSRGWDTGGFAAYMGAWFGRIVAFSISSSPIGTFCEVCTYFTVVSLSVRGPGGGPGPGELRGEQRR